MNFELEPPTRVMRPRVAKQSAEVVRREISKEPAAAPTSEIMVGSRSELLKRLERGSKRGEYADVGRLYRINSHEYAVKIRRIREEPPRWQKPAIILGGILVGTFLSCGVAAYALATLQTATLETFHGIGSAMAGLSIGTVLGVLFLAALVYRLIFGGGKSVRINIKQ